jgi:hypothetical protein
MDTYRCHKLVQADRIAGIDGNVLRLGDGDVREASAAWMERHKPEVGGFFVRYEDGYESFSPGRAFVEGYSLLKRDGLPFGDALRALQAGKRIARRGWNGKGMWLAYSPGSTALPADRFWAGPNREYANERGGAADVLPCITMKTATGEILMGWLASQSDMLADDWEIVP